MPKDYNCSCNMRLKPDVERMAQNKKTLFEYSICRKDLLRQMAIFYKALPGLLYVL